MRRALTVLLVLFVGTFIASTAAAQPVKRVEYYHLDALGSVRAVTDQQGHEIERHDYLPFGEEWPQPTFRSTLLFTGKQRDAESALDYFGARHYASPTGRFTTVDPKVAWRSALDNPQLWNRYAYALNNPLRFVDPDGRCVWSLCTVEAAIVGAAAITTTAWLVSPAGQKAVSQVVEDTRTIITTAVDAVASWFQTDKRPGTLGKPDHQATAADEAAKIEGEREKTIKTPGGNKDSRRGDVVVRDPSGKVVQVIQIYRPTPAGNVPKREQDAAADIEGATGVKPTMVPVRPIPK